MAGPPYGARIVQHALLKCAMCSVGRYATFGAIGTLDIRRT